MPASSVTATQLLEAPASSVAATQLLEANTRSKKTASPPAQETHCLLHKKSSKAVDFTSASTPKSTPPTGLYRGPRPDRTQCRARDRQTSGIGSLPHSHV